MEFTPITEREFRKKLKGCGIKYYSSLPKKELKKLLGFCPTNKLQRKVKISDDNGFSQIFRSMANAAKECKISNASALKYALDNKKETFTRRSDQKKFYIREIIGDFWDSDLDEDEESVSDLDEESESVLVSDEESDSGGNHSGSSSESASESNSE